MSRVGILATLAVCISGCSHTELQLESTPPVHLTAATIGAPPEAGSTVLSPNAVQLQQFVIPNHNAMPQDVAVGRDGALWFTEMNANALGRLDPEGGSYREFPLPQADSKPHQLAIDRDGNVWFTASARAYIGKLDAASGRVTEYRMPDARAKDPHSLAFARDGSLWFTVLQASAVGHLDPATGAVKLLMLDQPGAYPYDIGVDRDGAAYFSEYGLNVIRRVDPQSMQTREYRLPPGTRARQLAVSWHDENALFYTDFARGKIARLDLQSGVVQEWQTPGGMTSQPYALALTRDGNVWFAETSSRPNVLVRFDPRASTFASMALPADAGVVRKLSGAPDDRLIIASGNDRITVLRERIAVALRERQ